MVVFAVPGDTQGRDKRLMCLETPTARKASSDDPATVLERIAQCESGGDPTAVSRDHRYFGKYQFSKATWRTVGGEGNPAKASEDEQDMRAMRLYKRRGTAPWPVCGKQA